MDALDIIGHLSVIERRELSVTLVCLFISFDAFVEVRAL